MLVRSRGLGDVDMRRSSFHSLADVLYDGVRSSAKVETVLVALRLFVVLVALRPFGVRGDDCLEIRTGDPAGRTTTCVLYTSGGAAAHHVGDLGATQHTENTNMRLAEPQHTLSL